MNGTWVQLEAQAYNHVVKSIIEAKIKAEAITGPSWLNLLTGNFEIFPRLRDTSSLSGSGVSTEETVGVHGARWVSAGTWLAS